MYHVPALTEYLSQGDIFKRRCVFPYTASLTEDYLVLTEGQEAPQLHSAVPNAWADNKAETVLLHTFSREYFILLNSSCDIESPDKPALEYILVGAILPLSEMTSESQRNSCRQHKQMRAQYLEAHPESNFPESFVHFGLVSLVAQQELLQNKSLRILAIDPPHREHLSHRFGEVISRVVLD
jgi:hypothetical protein